MEWKFLEDMILELAFMKIGSELSCVLKYDFSSYQALELKNLSTELFPVHGRPH